MVLGHQLIIIIHEFKKNCGVDGNRYLLATVPRSHGTWKLLGHWVQQPYKTCLKVDIKFELIIQALSIAERESEHNLEVYLVI